MSVNRRYLSIPCAQCKAPAGTTCKSRTGLEAAATHAVRIANYVDNFNAEQRAKLASK